ncbi:8-amino-7-oxononanoate synthase [Cytobacillus firmus]|uniref:8-amino-7-oxononanoate synthase n=1 Tax=Cytobacillus TaxID=2675230 RepID=UPI002163E335|nr:8-amino-7-oxononanoate synthase [Cytobacillus firmus]MCS0671930.1 8-amino-7-oxononanoate synthase [Cytobacillus firmus]
MKKAAFVLVSLMLLFVFNAKTSEAAYLPEYDKYVEVSYEQARYIADLMGLQNYELGEETARLSFELQESLIAKIEKVLKTEIDHYYIWLTVDGETVLGIDPPHPMF